MNTMIHIRWMMRRDLLEILAIEESSKDHPWDEERFLQVLRNRNCIGMVAEGPGERVLGFFVYKLHKTSLEVLNVAVHSDHRHHGIGRQMLTKLIGKLSAFAKLSAYRRSRIKIHVPESNLDAQLWLRACGFHAVNVERAYNEVTGEYAYLFVYQIQQPEGTPVQIVSE